VVSVPLKWIKIQHKWKKALKLEEENDSKESSPIIQKRTQRNIARPGIKIKKENKTGNAQYHHLNFSAEQKEEMFRLHKDMKWSQRQIAAQYGICHQRVSAIFKELENPSILPKVSEKIKEKIAQIFVKANEPMTQRDIANQVGVSAATVSNVRRQLGVPSMQPRITEEQKERIVTLFRDDALNTQEIANREDISYSAVRSILEKRGLLQKRTV
jgi:transposase-like protein